MHSLIKMKPLGVFRTTDGSQYMLGLCIRKVKPTSQQHTAGVNFSLQQSHMRYFMTNLALLSLSTTRGTTDWYWEEVQMRNRWQDGKGSSDKFPTFTTTLNNTTTQPELFTFGFWITWNVCAKKHMSQTHMRHHLLYWKCMNCDQCIQNVNNNI